MYSENLMAKCYGLIIEQKHKSAGNYSVFIDSGIRAYFRKRRKKENEKKAINEMMIQQEAFIIIFLLL